ncbi:MAG: LemA family protein [Caulobacter sp.]|jgi:LemA protein|nr:LemA family protein [Caulobacter sp.]
MELIIVIVVLAVLALILVGIYNRLVALRARADQAFADIDVQLKQRHDLIPNLVETVKGYAAHETSTLEAVIQARNQAEHATTVEGKVQAEAAVTAGLGRLFAIAEAYPDLKANTNFLSLQSELSDVENKLAAARRFFNNAIAEYNTGRQSFPAVLFAGLLGFGPRSSFDLGEQRDTLEVAPSVKF